MSDVADEVSTISLQTSSTTARLQSVSGDPNCLWLHSFLMVLQEAGFNPVNSFHTTLIVERMKQVKGSRSTELQAVSQAVCIR